MILLIDNYDSFTFNLYHYICEVGNNPQIIVKRNDEITIQEINSLNIQSIIISPGPCSPNEAGISLEAIMAFKETIPILGVCLGHQAIGQAFGGKIVKTTPFHGKVSKIFHNQQKIFKDIPSPIEATRYHSLIIEKSTLPSNLEVTATTEDGIIMAIEHKFLKIFGVQFHPESILSQFGHNIIKNFLDIAKNN